jgi:signal transduction histidine kinase
LQITVSDNGLGMPPNLAAHCFEPGVTSKPGARGLGLALVHRLVRGARGEITLRSTPDEGTTFDIILPKPPGRGANT